jgi:hypothetical protein
MEQEPITMEVPDIENPLPAETRDGDEDKGHGCCGRFRAEFSMSFFQMEDHNGTLDIDQSFATSEQRNWAIIAIKFILWGLTVATLIRSWSKLDYPGFYLAFLSHWSMVYASLYMTLSFLLTLGVKPSWLMKSTWILFSIAAVHEMAVVLLFWTLDYDPANGPPSYNTIMVHGGVMALVMIDGLIVNRVPVRLKHTIVTMCFSLLYITWSVLQNTVYQYNPCNDDEADDDAIYDVLKWRENTAKAVIISCIVVFFILPLFSTIVWGLSLGHRRYKPTEETDEEKGVQMVEDHVEATKNAEESYHEELSTQ